MGNKRGICRSIQIENADYKYIVRIKLDKAGPMRENSGIGKRYKSIDLLKSIGGIIKHKKRTLIRQGKAKYKGKRD